MNQQPSSVDPVCGMTVDTQTANWVFRYLEKDYYFCAEACRQRFEKAPTRYLEDRAVKKKGFWARYLARLNRATGGKPPSCCSG